MVKMSSKRSLLILFLVILVAGIAGASTTVYTSRAEWEIVLGAYEEEFFDDDILNPDLSVVTDAGHVTGGVWRDELTPQEEQTTTWQFTAAVSAFGGYWNLAGPGGEGTSIAVSIDGNSVGEIPNTYSGQFWGFISTEPFSSVYLHSGSTPGIAETYEMDNMVYAADGWLELTKTADVNQGDCVVPGSEINYTITCDYTGPGDTNALLIDYLPVGVDYNSSTPEGDYNEFDGTVTWNIGTAPADGSGTFSLSCIVNYSAEPCSIITNICELIGDSTDEIAEVNTPVCFWNQIIYVDHNATGLNNGLSWEDAYLDLQDALDRAAVDGNSEIWVAAGAYEPSVPTDSPTFQFVDGIGVYGHFAGTESFIEQRNFNDPNNETFLSKTGVPTAFIVTASGQSHDNILDGFTILGAGTSGVKIENAYMTVSNCIISGDSVAEYGIYDINSAFKVTDCVISNSGVGIYADFQNNGALADTRIKNSIIQDNQTGIGFYEVVPGLTVEVENCLVHNNNYGVLCSLSSSTPIIKGCLLFSNSSGIYLNSSSAAIFNNWIYRNTTAGIYLYYPASPTTIRNDTIAYNAYGIYRYGGTAPVINSSIVCSNTSSDLGGNTAVYSWVTADGDPLFVDADMNDFHISPFSPCVNAGDPNFSDSNEVDIDGQSRLMIGETTARVDIGADEIDWPKADFDRDEIVNFIDFALFAPAWLTTDVNISLDEDSYVDINDLAEFAGYWLWKIP